MPTERTESLSDLWNSRFDDRDDEDLTWHIWSQRLAAREKAMAQPVRNFSLPEDAPVRDAANDPKPSAK